MNRFAKTLSFTLVAFALSVLSVAHAGPLMRLDTPQLGIVVDIEDLGVMTSAEGETKVDFLKRVGVVLDEFSARTGFEGCSKIWTDHDKAWGVHLTSAHAHNTCVITNLGVKGMVMLKEGIHSHPPSDSYRVNETDRAFILAGAGTSVQVNDWARTDGATFSPQDFGLGPGYLVSRGQLLHQSGRRSIENLGAISPPVAVAAN